MSPLVKLVNLTVINRSITRTKFMMVFCKRDAGLLEVSSKMLNMF